MLYYLVRVNYKACDSRFFEFHFRKDALEFIEHIICNFNITNIFLSHIFYHDGVTTILNVRDFVIPSYVQLKLF